LYSAKVENESEAHWSFHQWWKQDQKVKTKTKTS